MSWFASKCPVTDEERLWIEDASRWLIEEFGLEVVQNAEVILPTEDFFPDKYFGGREDVLPMLKRVCGYMDVDYSNLSLRFYSEHNESFCKNLIALETSGQGTVGYYQNRKRKPTIGIEISQLNDPTSVVATIARELGHVILLGENRVSYQEADHEPLTDLLTVFLGMGVFTANSAFTFRQWTDTFSQGWQAQVKGYLSEEMFGYALALFAWIRKEKKPEWSRYLVTNVKSYFKQSRRYIEKNESALLEELKSVVA